MPEAKESVEEKVEESKSTATFEYRDEEESARQKAKALAVEVSEDHTAADGYVGTHFSYEHSTSDTDEPRYSSDDEKKLYEKFGDFVSEPAFPFDRESTLEKLKAREQELADSTGKKAEEDKPKAAATSSPSKPNAPSK